MGNWTSKKRSAKEPKNFFDGEKRKEQLRKELMKKNLNEKNRRVATNNPALPTTPIAHTSRVQASKPAPVSGDEVWQFNDEALEQMHKQLYYDIDAFLLNNILLSVQFFENYEREVEYIKKNPINDREHVINEAMVQHNKHVFFADRLQECVNEHVGYQKQRYGPIETLSPARQFIIYDNIEARNPGDTSDYSAVLDAPFYKLTINVSKELGYIQLQKLEVLESTVVKDNDSLITQQTDVEKIGADSDDLVLGKFESDNDSELDCEDDFKFDSDKEFKPGQAFLNSLRNQVNASKPVNNFSNINFNEMQTSGRRASGPIKRVKNHVEENSIVKLKEIKSRNSVLLEEEEHNSDTQPRKSILKNSSANGMVKKNKPPQGNSRLLPDKNIGEDPTFQENEPDYTYVTLTNATTPRKVDLSSSPSNPILSGELPDDSWNEKEVRVLNLTSENSRLPEPKQLYDTLYYLNSVQFMKNFENIFIAKLGSDLGFSQKAVRSSMTQGASIYCDNISNKGDLVILRNEIIPALYAGWPHFANEWFIRERKIVKNPRTNFSYQWPTTNMVSKTEGFGCLLLPLGYRPKRGVNEDRELQWKIIFPAAERYLESCLAHAHMRCYLFALTLQKTFLETEPLKIGVTATHLKTHLFWQCENNYASWPEHRLGEVLMNFLKTYYTCFTQSNLKNYFIRNCNDFKNIPQPLLQAMQSHLKNIIENPVMHVLFALDKLKYRKAEFYPAFNVYRLYDILTTDNILRLINPDLPNTSNSKNVNSDGDNVILTFWDKVKMNDKDYQWKRENQRQYQEKRNALSANKKSSSKRERNINTKLTPQKMDVERRRLVLEFFISHFIEMASSSEVFEAIRQAVVYLEHAQRLCELLKKNGCDESILNKYTIDINNALSECQKKLVKQVSNYRAAHRESNADRIQPIKPRLRPAYLAVSSNDSPTDTGGFQAFTFADVHVQEERVIDVEEEDSKL